jgi:hypothetical protein
MLTSTTFKDYLIQFDKNKKKIVISRNGEIKGYVNSLKEALKYVDKLSKSEKSFYK